MNENKGIMPTKIELTLEQSQQGVSNDVLVSIEGVEELKRNVWKKVTNGNPSMKSSRVLNQTALRYGRGAVGMGDVSWRVGGGAERGTGVGGVTCEIPYESAL
ncbi:hypothetical protein Tco_1361449 [Tanacetum coccineum]